VADCSDLAGVDLASFTGGPTTLSATQISGANPYCLVTGTIDPAIRFEVHLPMNGWTQRYLQTGCGGLCGDLRIDAGTPRAAPRHRRRHRRGQHRHGPSGQ
jgi:feruloyl esterase